MQEHTPTAETEFFEAPGVPAWARIWRVRAVRAVLGFLARAGSEQQGRLFLWMPVWVGVGAGVYFGLLMEPPGWVAAAGAGLGLVALLVGGWWPPARLGLAPIACVCIGFAAAKLETVQEAPLGFLPKRGILVEGRVQGVDLLPDGGRRLTIGEVSLAGSAPMRRALRLTMDPDDPVTPAVGDLVRTRGLLASPDPPSWPGGRDTQFEDYFAGLAGSGKALALTEDLGGGGGEGFIAGLREKIAARALAALPGSEGAIAATLMAGASQSIPAADRAAFANSGLAHILAVAGLHMATVMGLVFGVVRLGLVLVPRWGVLLPCKEIAAVAGLLAGFGYLLLTGDHVPTERSFAMAALVVLGVVAGRRVVSLRGLALAALVVLLVSPHALLGVSFQMSFAAVLALIAGYRAMEGWLARMREVRGAGGWVARHAVLLCLTSFLAGTASLPFAAASFGQIQVYYILANLVAVPITVVVVMPMAVAGLLLMPVGAAAPAFWVMGKGIWAVLWVARAVSALPAAVVVWPPTPGWGLVLTAAGIAVLGLMAGRIRWVGALPLAVGVVSPFFVVPPDFLLARDGRAVAWRDAGVVRVWAAKSGAAYELADWRKVWPAAEWEPTDCEGGVCRFAGGQGEIVTRAKTEGCSAKLILSADLFTGIVRERFRSTEFDVWRNGAYEGWWRNGAAVVVSDRGVRGARPWVRFSRD